MPAGTAAMMSAVRAQRQRDDATDQCGLVAYLAPYVPTVAIARPRAAAERTALVQIGASMTKLLERLSRLSLSLGTQVEPASCRRAGRDQTARSRSSCLAFTVPWSSLPAVQCVGLSLARSLLFLDGLAQQASCPTAWLVGSAEGTQSAGTHGQLSVTN